MTSFDLANDYFVMYKLHEKKKQRAEGDARRSSSVKVIANDSAGGGDNEG